MDEMRKRPGMGGSRAIDEEEEEEEVDDDNNDMGQYSLFGFD